MRPYPLAGLHSHRSRAHAQNKTSPHSHLHNLLSWNQMGVPNSVSSWQESIYLPTKLTVIFFRIIKINQIRPFVLVHVVASRSSGSQIILHLQLSNLHVGVLPLFPSCPISRYDAFQNLLMAIRKNPLSLISSLNTSFTIFPWRRK